MTVEAVVALLGMGLATYGTRAGGLWLMNRRAETGRLEVWLRHVPGSILMAIVAPAAVLNGPADAVATAVAALVAVRTRNIPVTLIAGVIAVVALRHVL